MPVSQALLTSGDSLVNATSYTTASITPGGNKLIRATVENSASGDAENVAPSLSGNGLTWVQVATLRYPVATPGDNNRITLFRAMGAAPSAGAVTIDFGVGNTQESIRWEIGEFGNVDTGGTNGSAAVVQSATNRADGVSSLTITLAAFASADNATFGCFANTDGATAVTPGVGFTEIADLGGGEAFANRLQTEWRSDNDTTVDASGATINWAGIAVEIKFASALVIRRPSRHAPHGVEEEFVEVG